MNAPTKIDVPSVTRELAEFAVKLRYEDLPPEVINDAKRCILDSLGCGVFGAKTPWVESVTRVVERLGQSKTASAWGMKVKADPLGVSFINGTAAQGYELDDCHDQSMSHYGAGVIPAVLACAEAFGKYDGKQIILAVVAGFELGTRIGNTVSPHAFHRGFHPCGLTSTFASAAAIGKMLNLWRQVRPELGQQGPRQGIRNAPQRLQALLLARLVADLGRRHAHDPRK